MNPAYKEYEDKNSKKGRVTTPKKTQEMCHNKHNRRESHTHTHTHNYHMKQQQKMTGTNNHGSSISLSINKLNSTIKNNTD